MSEIPEDLREKAEACLTPAQWNPDTVQAIAQALAAERERADRLEAALLEAVTGNFWDAYHYGIEKDDKWWHGAVSDAEWLTRELELPSGWNDKAIVQAMIPSAVDRYIARIRSPS